MAAVLACGDDAGLSHACATALWEIRPYSGVWIDVTVPTRAGRKKRDRLRVHRCGTLTAADITTHEASPSPPWRGRCSTSPRRSPRRDSRAPSSRPRSAGCST